MPEIPEIASRAREMNTALVGKTIQTVQVMQPKCLNLSVEEFQTCLSGSTIAKVGYHGKWIQTEISNGWLLLNMGMGGEILLVQRTTLPEKYRLIVDFTDSTCLSINFWWFGYAHFSQDLLSHTLSARLGPNVLDLSREEFRNLTAGQRTNVKSYLLDQSRMAGIGNAYIHDILFLAKIHPLRKLASLSSGELDGLFDSIQAGLLPSLELGGAFYEKDLFGQPGGFTGEKILIGYREHQPCPVCKTPITKIKTGSTGSYICPHCQPL